VFEKDFGLTNNILLRGSVRPTYYSYNGQYYYSEPGIQSILVYVDLNNDGERNPDEPFKCTDNTGRYSFSMLPAGTYTVREVVSGTWHPVNNTSRRLKVASGATAIVNFGLSPY
jgi:hypothetical protein